MGGEKRKYVMLVVEADAETGVVIEAKPAVELAVEDMEEARWWAHLAFENLGVLQCDHTPLPIPAAVQRRIDAAAAKDGTASGIMFPILPPDILN